MTTTPSKLSGSDHLIANLNRIPILGRLAQGFVSEARRRRIEDTIYLKRTMPRIKAINEACEALASLTDDQLKAKTQEFRAHLKSEFSERVKPLLDEVKSKLEAVGKPASEVENVTKAVAEANLDHLIRRQLKLLEDGNVCFDKLKQLEIDLLNEIMIDAFAVVKEACRRNCGEKWMAAGNQIDWQMIPFDVQLAGAMEIHAGNVVEMSTGEGKTLVALMPIYLNALLGHGAHLITVNDYLARRDSEWTGHILEWLGLTVGCLDKTEPGTPERIAAYECDVTYGTNNEFGFDYLRDNMAIHKTRVVQRGHHFAIIDEVDSVLIDEARTPLIISGPVDRSTNNYDRIKPIVTNLVRKQNTLVSNLCSEAEKLLEAGERDEAGVKLMWANKGGPKHPRLVKLFQDPSNKKLATDALDRYTLLKRLPEVEEILHFVIDEKGNAADLTDLGRHTIAPGNPDAFVMVDLVDEIAKIENDEQDPVKREELKAQARQRHDQRSEELHSISQFLRAMMLFEKDVDYVVQDNKVIIVDEFTGRLMVGRRWSDGLHQAVESKEGVKVQRETQTLANITIQNYFRMYEKLAGMTGTAETDASEFNHTYKMNVQRIPTNRPVARIDAPDVLYQTKREKYNAVVEEIRWLHEHKQPVLIGTTSVDDSQVVAKMLKRAKIPCDVLNAKEHQREAEIIQNAGQPGSVTVSTNMAGRGTDIKLGRGVIRCDKDETKEGERCPGCPWRGDNPINEEFPTCGLQVVGCARHESRRIDRQLRGRSGRQGDPGYSRFFLSFEDELLRLFLSERAVGMVTKYGRMKEGDQIESALLTRQVGKAQSKVEAMNFDTRKRVLEYDDVMNTQRDVIYTRRGNALFASPDECLTIILESCGEAMEDVLDSEYANEVSAEGTPTPAYDHVGFLGWIQRMVPYSNFQPLTEKEPPDISEKERIEAWRDEFLDGVIELTKQAFALKAQQLGEEMTLVLTQYVVLNTIDSLWRDHLNAMEELRQGVGLRGYAQKNPLHEYQNEAFQFFNTLMGDANRLILERWFRMQPVLQRQPQQGPAQPTKPSQPQAPPPRRRRRQASPVSGALTQAMQQQRMTPQQEPKAELPVDESGKKLKVGRNDPCPCGSGKKFKKCCGQQG